MDGSVQEITQLLRQAQEHPAVLNDLFRLIQVRFRQIAGRLMKYEAPGQTLQETVLVDDAFQRLLAAERPNWANREQFFCTAAKVMRRLLVDHARQRKAQRRGGGEAPVGFAGQPEPLAHRTPDPQRLLELTEVVERLEQTHPDVFAVFNLHYFMGYELKEIAEQILDIPYATVKRRWAKAKAFLQHELTDP
ncbi:MAG: ECF-type sigma factor [Planctomycetota bacterium]|nr:ECF-type sigma factor [Planctomycetota bacterium]